MAYGCGFFEEAQALASEVWTTAFTSGLQLETALISLDRRILEAFGLLRHGFGAQTATVEIVEEVRRFVARTWRNPEMPFR